MSTTTGSTTSTEAQTNKEAIPAISGKSWQGWLLIVMVFIAGAVSLSTEMAASRLLTPYFGSTQLVWATIIGLILLYLTVGYYVGGLLSDRYPRPQILYSITASAALFTILIPFIGHPILHWTQITFSANTTGVFYGSLCAVIALFAIPTILLGCVSPYAIRLRVIQIGKAGHVAGLLYAISTAGSILGTFLPVLVLLPDLGTTQTFIVSGVILLLFSIVGLLAKGQPTYPL
jgi:predicted membrane-bound spermidine synthase